MRSTATSGWDERLLARRMHDLARAFGSAWNEIREIWDASALFADGVDLYLTNSVSHSRWAPWPD
jgi:hypothetical protein